MSLIEKTYFFVTKKAEADSLNIMRMIKNEYENFNIQKNLTTVLKLIPNPANRISERRV